MAGAHTSFGLSIRCGTRDREGADDGAMRYLYKYYARQDPRPFLVLGHARLGGFFDTGK